MTTMTSPAQAATKIDKTELTQREYNKKIAPYLYGGDDTEIAQKHDEKIHRLFFSIYEIVPEAEHMMLYHDKEQP